MVVKKCVSKNNLGNRVGPEYYFLFDINKKSITDTLTSEQIKQDIRDNKYTVINYHITPAGRLEHNNPKDNDYVDNYLTKNFDTRFDKLEQKLKKTAPALTFKWSLADEAVPMLFLREDNITQVDVVYTINCYIQGVKIDSLTLGYSFCGNFVRLTSQQKGNKLFRDIDDAFKFLTKYVESLVDSTVVKSRER